MSNFKIALTAIFAICIVVAIGIFALSRTSTAGTANLVVWGTLDTEVFTVAYKNSSLSSSKLIRISYVKKSPATFDQEFVEALANGTGPDMVMLRDDSVYKNSGKLFVIPYANYSERSFKDTFIEEGEMFLSPNGIVAVPFQVDPLVMYWNRDMFGNSLIPQPPKYWDEMYPLIGKMTRKDASGNVLQSALAFGEWNNVTNAKEIVAGLLLQAGTPITSRGTNGTVNSVLNLSFGLPIAPSQSALSFYTQFSNPTSPNYTWNRSLPSSFNLFLSGNLAMYFGFASEIGSIQQKNANLNFDVTYMPQIRDNAKKITFGHIYALAIVKQSKQIVAAFTAIGSLSGTASLKATEAVTNLPPVRRDLLTATPADAFREVFYNSALLAHSWIDPNAAVSSNIFRDMIESVTSGRARLTEALDTANSQINDALSI